jgi:hypothetical protein
MSDRDPHTTVTASMEPVTAELVMPRFSDDENPDVGGDLGSEDWPTQTVKHGVRLRMSTAILLALFLVAAGLWGGSYLQKHDGSSTSTSGFAALARSALSRTGASGSTSTSPFGASTSGTSGTVTDIIGNTLYVTSASGSLVKVTLSSSASVTRNATSTLAGLKPGDTVTVQGTKVSNGAMTASSVSATAKGVTSTSGFGSGFGGGTGSLPSAGG